MKYNNKLEPPEQYYKDCFKEMQAHYEKENAELRTYVECLRNHAMIIEDSRDECADIISLIDDAYKVPALHLADIKADAIIEAANNLCITGSSVKTVRYDKYIEYAEKLRGCESDN